MTDYADLKRRLERFDFIEGEVDKDKDGHWVRYDDHAAAIEALCHQIERVEAHDAMVVKALVDLYGEAMLDTSTPSFKQAMFGALNAIQQSKWPYPVQITAS